MILSRLNYKPDYKQGVSVIVDSMTKYIKENNLHAMILGISGGIDSTVTASLCSMVAKRLGIPLIGVSMPCSTNAKDEVTTADLVGKAFCDEYTVSNIQSVFEQMEKLCAMTSGMKSTNISQGNIKARLRMVTLYDIASKRSGIVIDTDNLSEMYTGFYTIHGDQGDLNPIGSFWKTEIYGLAKYLLSLYEGIAGKYNNAETSTVEEQEELNEALGAIDALRASIALIPTDGNGVSSSDLDQIMPGYTYDDVDAILQPWVTLDPRIKEDYLKNGFNQRGTVFAPLVEKYGEENVKRVIMRCVKSEFKRRHLPLVIDIENGNIVDK